MNALGSRWARVSRSVWFRYGIAIVAATAAVLARAWLDRGLGNYTPYITLYPMVVFLAAWLGFGPSFVSMVLGGVAVTYLFVPPRHSFIFWQDRVELIASIVYFLFGTIVSVVGGVSRSSRARLARTQALFETFLDNSPGTEFLKQADGTYVYANRTTRAMFRSDFVGKSDFDLVAEPYASQWRANDLLVLKDGKAHEFIETSEHADGMHTWWSFKFPVVDAEGRQLLGGKSMDITDKKRTEDALRATTAQLRQFLDTAGTGLVRCSRDFRYLAANPAYAEIVGRPLDAIIGHSLLEVLGAEAWERVRPYAERVLQGERVEFEPELPEGIASRFVHAVYTPERNEAGHVIGWVASVTDITRLKRLEQLARNASAQLSRFMDTAAVGLVRCSSDLRFVAANRAYTKIAGLPLDQIIGRRIMDVIGEEAWNAIEPSVRRVLQGETVVYETLLPYASGGPRYVHVVWTPDLDAADQVVGWIAAVTDITEAKRAEERLHKIEKLAAAGQLAASLAHEINNPLSSVINALYLLKRKSETDEETAFLVNTAAGEMARVARIVKQSLSYYRADAMPLPLDIEAIVEESLQIFADKVRHAGIQVSTRLSGGASILGFADEVRQVIDNLLLNAIEATPDGGRLIIAVRPAWDPHDESRTGARLTIADTGSGIPRDCVAKIFEPFFTTKAEKGTGLGLWVVRGILIRHDALMRIRSRNQGPWRGTVVSILWPSAPRGVGNIGVASAKSGV